MMPKVVAIYGESCTLKSDIAREISRLTGYKVKHVGEGVTTRAKVLGLDSGVDVEDAYQARSDLGGQTDALEFAPRQGGGVSVQ